MTAKVYIEQSGRVTPTHAAVWTTNGVLRDGGAVTSVNSILITGKVVSYETNTAARAATVPADAEGLQTYGYYAVGDNGDAFYTREVSDPGAGGFQSADGAWWRLIINGPANVRQFGATGDGATDDATAVQNAIDAGYATFVPAGTFIISTPLVLGSFKSIFGEGPASILKAKSGVFPNSRGILQGAAGFCSENRVTDLQFVADSGTMIWGYDAAFHNTGVLDGYFSRLYFNCPGGLNLVGYTQATYVDGLHFAGDTDVMIASTGNLNHFRNLDKEGGTGVTVDPYIKIYSSEHAHLDGILIEQTTSINKNAIEITDSRDIVISDLWHEPSDSAGYAIIFDNVTAISLTDAVRIDRTLGKIWLKNGSQGKVDTFITLDTGATRTLDDYFVVDATSYLEFGIAHTPTSNNMNRDIDAVAGPKTFVETNICDNLFGANAIAGLSPVNSFLPTAGENLLVNPSFEAGNYGWATNGSTSWSGGTSYTTPVSAVGPGRMISVTSPSGATWGIQQRIAVPADWVGHNLTLSFLVAFTTGSYVWPYVNGAGLVDQGINEFRTFAATPGTDLPWSVINMTFAPQAAGNLDVGVRFGGSSDGVSELMLDKFRLAFGTKGMLDVGQFNDISLGAGVNTFTTGAAAPITGDWKLGDTVFNSTPTSGGPAGWMCTVAGTPGTWKAMANLA